MKSIRLLATLFASAVLALFLPSASAQTTNSCPNDGSGEAIQCRMGNLLAKNETLLTKIQAKLAACDTSDAHCAALQRHLNRAQNAHRRAKKAHELAGSDNYHQLTLKPHFKRNSKKGGGNNVMVAAVSGGDPDTVDTDYDPNVGITITDGLDDAADAIDDATNLAETPEPTPPHFEPGNVYDFTRPSDEPAYPAWLHPHRDEKIWIRALFGLKIAAKATEIVYVGAEHACMETLVIVGEGGNGSLACLALGLTVATLEYEVDWMEFMDKDLLYWEAKGANENAKRGIETTNKAGEIIADAAGDIGAVKAKVDAIAEYIDTRLNPDMIEVKASLKLLHEEVLTNQALIREAIRLELTPDGRKVLTPGISSCLGNKCPNVLYRCGASVCSFPF